ncbi:Purine efflux pump PbuE (plasmid) [Actinosynnema sp. ALI-1.44]
MADRVAPRTYALASATVAAGTSGYLAAAVLPDIAAELEIGVAQAGQSITAFALAYALAAPVLAAGTARWERRGLLVVALLVTGIGNVAVAAADGLGVLLAARVLTALGAALTTPAATALAAQVNRDELRARAMAVVTGGLTAATVLGIPAGRLVADELGGHRAAFLLAALLCGASAVLVGVFAPTTPGEAPVGLGTRLAVLRDRATRRLLATSLLACLGTFAAYGYLGVLVTEGSTESTLPLVLLAFGMGGVLGNVAGGRAADRFGPRRPLVTVLAGCAVSLALLGVVARGTAGTIGLVVVAVAWGALFWGFNPPAFAALLQRDPARGGLLLGLNATAIYLGIAGAGVLGGVVADHLGAAVVPPTAAAVTAVAAVTAALVGPTVRPRPPRSDPGAPAFRRGPQDTEVHQRDGAPARPA